MIYFKTGNDNNRIQLSVENNTFEIQVTPSEVVYNGTVLLRLVKPLDYETEHTINVTVSIIYKYSMLVHDFRLFPEEELRKWE